MVKGAPIGVFDSGIGGLTVLEEIQQLLPHESLLYVADCGHIPYGEKTPAFILERSRSVAEFFRERGAKAFVIACNTATVAAVADLRQDYPDWPLVGMEPAVKPAAAATRSGVVGVLATTGTRPEDIGRVYLAGGFGMHLDVTHAIAIGLLPGFRPDQVQVVGNTALAGAVLATLDRSALLAMDTFRQQIEVVELNLAAGFEDCYIDHLALP